MYAEVGEENVILASMKQGLRRGGGAVSLDELGRLPTVTAHRLRLSARDTAAFVSRALDDGGCRSLGSHSMHAPHPSLGIWLTLTIVSVRSLPLRSGHRIDCPSLRPMSPAPTGVRIEIRPAEMLASLG